MRTFVDKRESTRSKELLLTNPAPSSYPSKHSPQFFFNFDIPAHGTSFPDQNDRVHGPVNPVFVETKELSQEPLDTIPIGGSSNLLADDNPQPVTTLVIGLAEKDEILGEGFLPGSHHIPEILRVDDPFRCLETKQSG